MSTLSRVIVVAVLVEAGALSGATPRTSCAQTLYGDPADSALEEAHRLFYSGDYEAAAAAALAVRHSGNDVLAASELRSSALHFRIRRTLGPSDNKEKAWRECSTCPDVLRLFMAEMEFGRNAARARLEQDPADEDALFFLGKIDLNYVWLHVATLGRKAGWSEYWEARKSLDAVLTRNPSHVRARVARAWIDYIVDTKVPRMTRWLFGGGNRKRGLQMVREAAQVEAPRFVQTEAMFALWDMEVRERNIADAVVIARALAQDFPDNRELARFLSAHNLRSSQ